MKKQLKKLLLVFGFVAVATLTFAGNLSYIRIDCGDGRGTNLITYEDMSIEDELAMARELKAAFCN